LELKELLENAGYTQEKLRLDNAEFLKSKDECILTFIYPDYQKLNDEQKDAITNLVAPVFVDKFKYAVKFRCSSFDNEIFKTELREFLLAEYKALASVINDEDVEFTQNENSITLNILCDAITGDILKTQGFVESLANYLTHKFFYDFKVHIDATKQNNYEDLQDTKILNMGQSLSYVLDKESRINKLEVTDIQEFLGKQMNIQPTFIAKLPHNDGEMVAIAGIVSRLMMVNYQKKPTKEGEQAVEKTKFSFTITDASGSVEIVMFPNEKDLKSLELIKDGQELMVGGVTSNFKDRFNIRGRNINFCKVLTQKWEYIYRTENPDYIFIKPEPLSEVAQMDLFSMSKCNENQNEFWKDNEVVMFDLETTGLDPKACQIIEIGAVKIVNGSCVETFQTLVNPKETISNEITNITHITNEMVSDAPTIEEVLPDFYKFVSGSVLSAYNISFDSQFIKNIGQKLRYQFNNKQIDALDLARKKVPSLHNYKLGTVVKALNIELINAHRALADAIAAAKVFIKLI